MPPKKSKKKEKKAKVSAADGEVTKDQLWDQLIALRGELEQMRKQKNQFRHESDNCVVSWENSKRRLEEKQNLMRERLRQKQESEKHYQNRIKTIHQQLKHVQLEHHNAISELKINAAALQCQRLNENTEREMDLHKKRLALQAALLEKKGNTEKCIKALMLKQAEDIMEMRQEYNDTLTQMQWSWIQKSTEMIREHSESLEVIIAKVEEEIAAKVNTNCQEVTRQWRVLKAQAEKLNKWRTGTSKAPKNTEVPNESDPLETEEDEALDTNEDSP